METETLCSNIPLPFLSKHLPQPTDSKEFPEHCNIIIFIIIIIINPALQN